MQRTRVAGLTLIAGLWLLSCNDPTAPETVAALSYVAESNGVWHVRTVRVDGSGDSALPGTDAASGNSQFLFHTWSLDGARLAMTEGQSSVRVVDRAGQITPIAIGTFVCDGITWSPDGSRIAFVAREPGTLKYRVWVMNRDGTGKVPLGPSRFYGNGCGNAIAWMPDGEHVVYSGDGDTEDGTWRSHRDGSGETLISPQRLFDIAVSPDGQRILGASYPLPSKAVVVLSVATGGELLRFETPSAHAFKFPRWSPDGQQIAGGVANTQFVWDLFLMNDDGSGFTPIDANNANTNSLKGTIEWSPDGQRLAFLKDGAIYVIGANGQQPTRVTADGVAEHSVRWIPVPPP